MDSMESHTASIEQTEWENDQNQEIWDNVN